MYIEELLRRWPRRLAVNVAIAAVIVAVAIPDISKVYFEDRGRPVEDIQGAVRFLRTHVQPGDLVLAHSEAREGVLFYARREGWSKHQVIFGDTGWPCCPRDKEAWPHFSTRDAVIHDLDSKIPRGFHGRIWLLYSTRPTHWQYTGLDEGDLWRRHVWENGCPPGPYFDFQNLAVSPMDCSGAGYTVGEPRR
jgi:hypothetical protein